MDTATPATELKILLVIDARTLTYLAPLVASMARTVFPLSVDASSPTNVNRSQPPPPKSPVHRTPTGNGSINDIARPPSGGSVGFMGFDRLMMMRQVNAAAVPPTVRQAAHGGDEASAAVNHRQRMAAEQQRRLELALMAKEDYTGTPEGQARLLRQEERSRMREEELLTIRLVEAEKQAARALQREKELEEEKRVKEQYLAKIRAQREQQEKEAKEKEKARKVEMERKMKALKEAADAKARAEFAELQHAIEEEARIQREKHLVEVENAQMQVEDVLGHAMQQEMIAERDRQRQIAAEQDEWRLFQEREQEKQREATRLRRAAMAQQYEQDKQRRIQIHKLQKERAAQQVERKEMQNRQTQREEVKLEHEAASATGEGGNSTAIDRASETVVPVSVSADEDDKKLTEDVLDDVSLTAEVAECVDSSGDAVTESEKAQVLAGDGDGGKTPTENGFAESNGCANLSEAAAIKVEGAQTIVSVGDQVKPQQDSPILVDEEPQKNAELAVVEKDILPEQTEDVAAKLEKESSCGILENSAETSEQEVKGPSICDIPEEASLTKKVDNIASITDGNVDKDANNANANKSGKEVIDMTAPSSAEKEHIRTVWSILAARDQGFIPFAQILSVVESSPAMLATLQGGDLLVEFGGIVSSTPKCLMAMAECVQKNLNNVISVVLLRPVELSPGLNFEEVRVSLCPRKWKGKGLLGCQLSPFKWPEEEETPLQKAVESEVTIISTGETVSSSDEGTSALVAYDIVPASVADQAGLLNGDILAGCDGMQAAVSVASLSDVVDHIQATRAACSPVYLDINRWIAEDQCYRSLRVVLPSAEDLGPLGFALTSFAEYYNYYTSSQAAAPACEECYYTSLTTALHAAALTGHVSCLEALLNSLQNGDGGGYTASDYLDWRDEDGRTPLFYACYAGQLECVGYLLTQSVSNEQQPLASTGVDLYGDTVLHAATTSGNVAVIALLLENGCVKVDDKNYTRLTCAHVAPNVETLAFLGEQTEADLLATDSEERMPLAYACLRNDVDSIEYLCNKHPDFVDYADIRGNTPLHVAAWLGLQEAAEVLIRFLPSIALYITNEDGQSAVELARSSGMEDVAAFLDSVIAAVDSNQ